MTAYTEKSIELNLLFYLNCRSLVNKLSLIQSFIYSPSSHIIALSETSLSDKIYSKEILPSGYIIYRSDRQTRGGGVLMCLSLSLSSHLIISHSNIDMVVVQLLISPPKTLCCLYIPLPATLIISQHASLLYLKSCPTIKMLSYWVTLISLTSIGLA